ncbi:MerR family DNA-binding protein [Gallibacterium melopsittaci]|uniref:MerR family DNA-binding protein n=1 Tax=Gallibacterium melopsittaci TaxID=516063 RepID=A0ABV6HVG1_9PAST
MTLYTIKKLSELSGVNVETIRFYEKNQVIMPAQRAMNGYRQFTTKHLTQLKFIKTCRSLGFDLTEIKTLLLLQDKPETDCYDANQMAAQHLQQVDQKIAELQQIRELLANMAQCDQHKVEQCLVINTLKNKE